MHLLRRVGAFVHGICIERDSSGTNYLPVAHFHNLLSPLDVVSLSLSEELKSRRYGGRDRISLKRHESEFQQIAARFRSQVTYSFDSDVKSSALPKSYEKFIRSHPLRSGYSINELYDICSILLWSSQFEKAESFIKKGRAKINSWPEQETRYMADRIDAFEALAKYLSDTNALEHAVEQKVELFGLQI